MQGKISINLYFNFWTIFYFINFPEISAQAKL